MYLATLVCVPQHKERLQTCEVMKQLHSETAPQRGGETVQKMEEDTILTLNGSIRFAPGSIIRKMISSGQVHQSKQLKHPGNTDTETVRGTTFFPGFQPSMQAPSHSLLLSIYIYTLRQL